MEIKHSLLGTAITLSLTLPAVTSFAIPPEIPLTIGYHNDNGVGDTVITDTSTPAISPIADVNTSQTYNYIYSNGKNSNTDSLKKATGIYTKDGAAATWQQTSYYVT